MLKIKKLVSRNNLVVAIFSVILLFSVAFVTNVALTANKTEKSSCTFSEKKFYFSDASHSTVIGYSGYLCNGQFVKSGRTSRFTDTLYCDCFEDTE